MLQAILQAATFRTVNEIIVIDVIAICIIVFGLRDASGN